MNKFLINQLIILSIVVFCFGLSCKANDSQVWLDHVPTSELKDTIIYQTQSDIDGKHYQATIYGRDLENIPKWKEGAELPLSMLTAKRLALSAFQGQFPQLDKYKLSSINIVHILLSDDWIIEVEFYNPKKSSPEISSIELLLLLNGQVIIPTEK